MGEKLGGRFWLWLVAMIFGIAIGAIVVVAIFGWAWSEFGFIGAFLLLIGAALVYATISDRRERKRMGGA